jgi:hypothetical protein
VIREYRVNNSDGNSRREQEKKRAHFEFVTRQISARVCPYLNLTQPSHCTHEDLPERCGPRETGAGQGLVG